jgi:DNA-binding MarR family transcriptional regulator
MARGGGRESAGAAPGAADEEPLADLILRTARSLRRRWSEGLAPWDLSPHQARALRVVAHHEPTRLGVVAEHLRIAPRSATEVVDGLESRGLVQRQPDPSDRRAVLVAPTAEGRRVLREIDRARARDSSEHLAVLTADEQEHLARLLRKLNP